MGLEVGVGVTVLAEARGFEKQVLCLVDVRLVVDLVVCLVVEVALVNSLPMHVRLRR